MLDMVHSMMSYATLLDSFWGYALETAAYILNHVPSHSVPKTPRELWAKRKPSLQHFRIWGCPAHVRKDKRDKLEVKTKVCTFIGYPKGTKGGLFYDPLDKKVIVSTNAIYLEEEYIMEHKATSRVVLEELQKASGSQPVESEELTHDRVASQSSHIPELLRRSGRTQRAPDRYYGETFLVDPEFQEDDPTSYEEAMESPIRDAWNKAMKAEMESMSSNSVWNLVTPSPNIKPIGCKWVYKRKIGPNNTIET